MFFVKYNDPIYVKLEKLDIMIRLASQANIAQVGLRAGTRGLGHPINASPCSGASGAVAAPLNSPSSQLGFGALHRGGSTARGLYRGLTSSPPWQVLAELKEYATEVDVDFVRKAVRAIGRCAIKVEVRLVWGGTRAPRHAALWLTACPARAGRAGGLASQKGSPRSLGRAWGWLRAVPWGSRSASQPLWFRIWGAGRGDSSWVCVPSAPRWVLGARRGVMRVRGHR